MKTRSLFMRKATWKRFTPSHVQLFHPARMRTLVCGNKSEIYVPPFLSMQIARLKASWYSAGRRHTSRTHRKRCKLENEQNTACLRTDVLLILCRLCRDDDWTTAWKENKSYRANKNTDIVLWHKATLTAHSDTGGICGHQIKHN